MKQVCIKAHNKCICSFPQAAFYNHSRIARITRLQVGRKIEKMGKTAVDDGKEMGVLQGDGK